MKSCRPGARRCPRLRADGAGGRHWGLADKVDLSVPSSEIGRVVFMQPADGELAAGWQSQPVGERDLILGLVGAETGGCFGVEAWREVS